MKIKNVSAKVIGVLGKDLMPDAAIDCNESTIKNESVAALISMGFLELDNRAEMEQQMRETMREEIMKELEEKEAASAEKKTRGRKAKEAVESAETTEA